MANEQAGNQVGTEQAAQEAAALQASADAFGVTAPAAKPDGDAGKNTPGKAGADDKSGASDSKTPDGTPAGTPPAGTDGAAKGKEGADTNYVGSYKTREDAEKGIAEAQSTISRLNNELAAAKKAGERPRGEDGKFLPSEDKFDAKAYKAKILEDPRIAKLLEKTEEVYGTDAKDLEIEKLLLAGENEFNRTAEQRKRDAAAEVDAQLAELDIAMKAKHKDYGGDPELQKAVSDLQTQIKTGEQTHETVFELMLDAARGRLASTKLAGFDERVKEAANKLYLERFETDFKKKLAGGIVGDGAPSAAGGSATGNEVLDRAWGEGSAKVR